MNKLPRDELHELLDNSKPIEFQITDWFIPETDKNKEKLEIPDEYVIKMYGTNEDNITICVNVIDYKPYFYIKPPIEWEALNDTDFRKKVIELNNIILEDKYECVYTDPNTKIKKNYMKKIVPFGYESHYKNIIVENKKDFWGFTNNKIFRFIKITVKSLYLYNNLKYYFQSRKEFKLYESNIDPFLKYIHIQKIKPCGWVKIDKYEIDEDSNTRCDYNVIAKWKNIIPLDVNKIAPFIIASFDIECMSSHGDFPQAKKNYKKLAQDLCSIVKAGFEYSKIYLISWILNAYIDDVIIEDDYKINRLYAKNKIDVEKIKKSLNNNIDKIISILEKIEIIIKDNDGGDDGEGDEENDVKNITVKEYNEIENNLCYLLSYILPELEGDKIIQIGTTVHKYGSDDIIYRNIITLNTCDDIEGVDVIACETETELLKKWKELFVKIDPDILTGYNICGFDFEYIWLRVLENNIGEIFTRGLGRTKKRLSVLTEQKLSSSALGDNIYKSFDIDGIVIIDLLKVVQKDHKLDSYKLDNVASVFIGSNKDDLKPNEIFKKFKGNSLDRCVIAKYCIQDCVLCNKLLHKLKIIENNIGMGNVCLVPFNYLFKRGQGIKIFSLINNECMKKGFLIPVIKNYIYDEFSEDNLGFEGAIVLDPKEGIYLNEPIVVFDYGSLYPSSMISRNLSHDTYINDKKYMVEDPNIEYKKIYYDIYEGLGDKKIKTGVKECIFAQYKDGKKGIIPDILNMLLDERKKTRNKIEYITVKTIDNKIYTGFPINKENQLTLLNVENGDKITIDNNDILEKNSTFNKFEKDVFDSLQSAYKITANSLYGQIGAKTSPIYLKDIAACTTSTGREMIMIAKNFVETHHNADVIYGDSVMPYTPITYLLDGKLNINTFEYIDDNIINKDNKDNKWIEYNNFKPNDIDRYEKEQLIPLNMKVWTYKGWSDVKRIIRHKTTKKIYRVITKTGLVDVTEDHSLLNNNIEIIKPKDCNIGTKLLHSNINNINDLEVCEGEGDLGGDINEEEAYIYGMFFKYGYCNIEDDKNYNWGILHNNLNVLTIIKDILEKIEDIPFKIIKISKYYKLIPDVNNYYNLVIKYNKNCYLKHFKIVPYIILKSNNMNILKSFNKPFLILNVFNTIHQITAHSYYLLLQKLKYNINIDIIDNVYKISYNSLEPLDININNEIDIDIKKISVLHNKYKGYVYDIETEEGVFQAGIGNLILKNTDSIFCKFPIKDVNGNNIYGKDALPHAIKIGQEIEKKIASILPAPQKLNYEKSLYPFILFSKKRYVGNLYETDINHFKQKSMGIVLKRRDNAPIVKKIYGGIIDIILNKQDLDYSIKFLRDELSDLVNGKINVKELILSKTLKSNYKDPSKIAHKVLADRIGDRDSGNKPSVNDRIQYVYIKNANAKLQGERIETPEFILEKSLIPDYLHYITNQIMKPVIQLYALCLDQLPNYDKDNDYWINLDKSLLEKPLYIDDRKRKNRLDNLKLQMVEELLFKEFINMLSEPKIRKERVIKEKAVKEKVVKEEKTEIKEKKTVIKKEKVVKEVKEVKKVEEDKKDIYEGVINIKKKDEVYIIKCKLIYNKDIIWEFNKNDDKGCKYNLVKKYIIQMIRENTPKIIINFKIDGYKPFIKEYKLLINKYNENINNYKTYNELNEAIKNASDNNDIGKIQDFNLLIQNQDIINYKDYIIIIE